MTISRTDPFSIEENPVPSSDDQSRIPCLIDHATGSWKSLTAAAMGKADPEMIETLTKRHSGRFLILSYGPYCAFAFTYFSTLIQQVINIAARAQLAAGISFSVN
jgi:hypothetical protein